MWNGEECACFYDILLVLLLLLNPFLSFLPFNLGCDLYCVYPHEPLDSIFSFRSSCQKKESMWLVSKFYIFTVVLYMRLLACCADILFCGIFAYLITVMSVSSCTIFQNDLGLWAKEHLVKSTRVSTDIEMGTRWKCLWRLRYVSNVLLQEIKCSLYFSYMKMYCVSIHFLYQNKYSKNRCVIYFIRIYGTIIST